MEDLTNLYYIPNKFSPNEKGIEIYQTATKENIYYKSLFPKTSFDAKLDHNAGSGKIWKERNSDRPLAPKLKKGEFAVVERKYAKVGMFEFTTRDNHKINNAADVAFIFRQLESEAVEQAFAVYIDKEKRPSVQWLSMGGINATIIDPRIMVDAAQRLKAREIYLVHNHPSGNLKPSTADMNIVAKLKNGFEPMGIMVNAIIINLVSGNYLQFDENGISVAGEGIASYDSNTEKRVEVFSFNKQAFLQSPINTRIQSPADAARFLSQQKFSSGKKGGYLLLSTKNEIVGNFFATNHERNKAYKEVAGLVSKFGATSVIAYTNKADNASFYRDLRADLKNLEIGLMDVIECESSEFVCQTFEKYKSLMEQGRLYEESTDYNVNKTGNVNTEYELGFGRLGSGITVWNRHQIENDDYKTIAHISDRGQVNFYDENLPDTVKLQIMNMADIQETKFGKYQNNEMGYHENNLPRKSYSFNQNSEVFLQSNQRSSNDTAIANEISTNYKTNKTKIMNTQNTLSEENLTGQSSELDNNEENYLQKNLDYINNQVKYLGFGEGHSEVLKEAMRGESDKINFPISKEFYSPLHSEKKQEVDFILHFGKGKESSMYFLNSYSAQLKGMQEDNNESQKFYINKGKGITAKESFNLLSGRAVNKDLTNKEGVTYNAWIKLKPSEGNSEKGNRDFQIFGENYGFDLEKTLSKYPVKEMETPEAADKLMNSLKKGNLQAVTFSENGQEATKFISTNPQFKNLDVLNLDGSKMFIPASVLNKNETAPKKNVQPESSPFMKENKSAGIKR
ncbi:MAG: JAB domain-containing protein [Bacteroidota bacterium]|nr:JAB domain-containing protein [Bacteroidota bacterium]